MSRRSVSALVIGGLACLLWTGCSQAGDTGAEAASRPAADVEAASTDAASTAAPPAATPPATAQPPEIAQWVEGLRRECNEGGGRWGGVSDYITTGDFNGDGRTDYILNQGGAACPHPDLGVAGMFGGGNAGTAHQFLLSGANGGYALHHGFSTGWLEPSNIVRRGDRDVVVLEGSWRRSGGEVTRVIWGWDGNAINVVERQDAQGRSVDEEGRPVRASGRGGGAQAALPFREGEYWRLPSDPEYTGSISITASMVRYSDSAVERACRVDAREVSGAQARLTLSCFPCDEDGTCTSGRTNPPYTVTIHAEDANHIRVVGAPARRSVLENVRYRYAGPPWGS